MIHLRKSVKHVRNGEEIANEGSRHMKKPVSVFKEKMIQPTE